MKADSNDFLGRFREVVSDPLNLVIQKDPRAGFIEGGFVYLHNGLKVPLSGNYAYYGQFSWILVINRGVHEPLEEFVFQEVLKRLPNSPLMIELGAYWAHYSMWLKLLRPDASVHLVEPELANLQVGKYNFDINGFTGKFIQGFVGKGHFGVDQYLLEENIDKVTILHSDVQGYEVEMLEGCSKSLENQTIDYLFISTHSQDLHLNAVKILETFNYRIEISSDFDYETTSCDGFIFASSPSTEPIFNDFIPMSRIQIAESQPELQVDYLLNLLLAN